MDGLERWMDYLTLAPRNLRIAATGLGGQPAPIIFNQLYLPFQWIGLGGRV